MHIDEKWLLVAGVIAVAALLEAAIYTFVMPSGYVPGAAVKASMER
jgi:hypothetical protein